MKDEKSPADVSGKLPQSIAYRPSLMALKNLGFLGFFKKPKKSEFRFFRFKKNKNLMSDLSF